jgi:predicted Zn-ribbon and HTH transcriptional regulator
MPDKPTPAKPLTVRQQLMHLLTGARHASRDLAALIGAPERQIEEHLAHVVRSLAKDATRRFVLEPSRCHDCGFVFRERTRLTTPGRCPACRSEAIAPPRFGIDARVSKR